MIERILFGIALVVTCVVVPFVGGADGFRGFRDTSLPLSERLAGLSLSLFWFGGLAALAIVVLFL